MPCIEYTHTPCPRQSRSVLDRSPASCGRHNLFPPPAYIISIADRRLKLPPSSPEFRDFLAFGFYREGFLFCLGFCCRIYLLSRGGSKCILSRFHIKTSHLEDLHCRRRPHGLPEQAIKRISNRQIVPSSFRSRIRNCHASQRSATGRQVAHMVYQSCDFVLTTMY